MDAFAARPLPSFLTAPDGVRLAVEKAGVGEASRVLLAHGFGQTRQSWASTQRALLAQGFGSVSYDARGHGESSRNPQSLHYSHEQLIADIALVASTTRAAGIAPVLVGASMGGLCGLVAQSHQPLFSALVLVDVTPRWENEGLQRILGFMRAHPEGFDSFDHAADEIARYLPHRIERKTPAQLTPLLRESDDGRLRWHWDPRLLNEFAEGSLHLQDDIAEAAKRIDIPTLLISGGRSDLVSQRTVEDFLSLVPHARHVQLPQATHMLAGDDNHAFTRVVAEFLHSHFPHDARTTHGHSLPHGVAV